MTIPNWEIKVFKSNRIIVKANGYQSALFMPHISSGKIVLLNIVGPNFVKDKGKENKTQNGEQNNKSINNRKSITNMPLPEIPSMASTAYSPLKKPTASNLKPLTPYLGPNVKVIRLHRNSSINSHRKVGKLVRNANLNNSFRGNKSILGNNSFIGIAPQTPVNLQVNRTRHTFLMPKLLGTATKWRKCLTPMKTYSKAERQKAKTPKWSTICKKKRKSYSETQGLLNEDYSLKYCKILSLIDKQIAISGKEFKTQLEDTSDLQQDRKYWPSSKIEFYNAHYTSFDILTNSTKMKCYSECLRKMFKKRCIRKTARIDPLFSDANVSNCTSITRKSLFQ